MGLRSYQDLLVWQKAMDLVEQVYLASEDWPAREHYGLTGQIRRAIVSVPANIAEGQGRIGSNEFAHHLSIASGSLHEAETHLHIARRLRYLDQPTWERLAGQTGEVGRLLYGLRRSIARPGTNDRRLTTDD